MLRIRRIQIHRRWMDINVRFNVTFDYLILRALFICYWNIITVYFGEQFLNHILALNIEKLGLSCNKCILSLQNTLSL